MKEQVVRIRIDPEMFKQYKIICVEKGLSVPKQTHELIRHFVEMLKKNKEYVK